MAIAFSISIISVQFGVTKIVLYGKWGVEQAGVRAVISSVSTVHLHQGPIGKPPFRLLRDYPKDLITIVR